MCDLYRDELLFQTNLYEKQRFLEKRFIRVALPRHRRTGAQGAALVGGLLVRIGRRLESMERGGKSGGMIGDPVPCGNHELSSKRGCA